MRIAIGQFEEESNTFVLQQADLRFFEQDQLLRGGEILEKRRGTHAEMGGFLDVLHEAGVEIVPTVAAHSVSSGIVPRETYETLHDELLARLSDGPAVDGV